MPPHGAAAVEGKVEWFGVDPADPAGSVPLGYQHDSRATLLLAGRRVAVGQGARDLALVVFTNVSGKII